MRTILFPEDNDRTTNVIFQCDFRAPFFVVSVTDDTFIAAA